MSRTALDALCAALTDVDDIPGWLQLAIDTYVASISLAMVEL